MRTRKKPQQKTDALPQFNDVDKAYRAWLVRRGFPLPEKMTIKGKGSKLMAAFFGGTYMGSGEL